MLKVSLFALVLAGACTAAGTAATGSVPLIVGSVRDRDGEPVEGAVVRAIDAAGGTVGVGDTDRAGTFAIRVAGSATAVEVKCRYCATERVSAPAGGGSPVVFIVRRYSALAGSVPSQRDFAALPYARPADTIALSPFVIPLVSSAGGDFDVSDRGLERGRGLVLDNGAPAYDLVAGGSALADFPDRSVQQVLIEPASAAYRYGSYAGGGTFILADRGPAAQAAGLDVGWDGSFAGYTRVGRFTPAVAASHDGSLGLAQQRGSLAYQSDFAGGVLGVDATTSDQQPYGAASVQPSRFTDALNLAYATASRRYRTFADLSASQIGIDDPASGTGDRSSMLLGEFRVEHPGPITTSLGIVSQRYTAGYSFAGGTLSTRVSDDLGYLQASGGTRWLSFDAGASVSGIALDNYRGVLEQSANSTVFLPSLDLRASLGGPFGVTASASRSLRIPTLVELAASPTAIANQPIELGSVVGAGLSYDDARRLRADATAFRENLQGFGDRQTTGVGVSLTWQVAPLLSLRAWTLHDAALSFNPPLYLPYTPVAVSRAVVWATYDNGGWFRVDAVAHRDLADNSPETDLDGDLVVRIVRGLDGTVGTSRLAGVRTTYVGVRLPL